MRLHHLGFIPVFLFMVVLAQAQDSTPPVLLPWGPANAQLGVYRDGDYLRGPGFFDRAADGSIWVADAYKQRLARFSSRGNFLGGVDLTEITPRMTAFRVAEDGTVVVSNDQTLSRWTSSGELLGRQGLGLVLPEAYWFTSDRTAVVLPSEAGWTSLSWDRSFENPTRLSLASSTGSLAAVKDSRGQFRMVFWKDQASVFGWKAPLDPRAQLVRQAGEETVWSLLADGQRLYWRVNAEGALVATASSPAVAGAPGLYSFGPGVDLWWGQWTEDGLLLQPLEWSISTASSRAGAAALP